MLLVARVVLAENHVFKVAVFINYRKGVELVLPNKVARLRKGNTVLASNKLCERSHVLANLRFHVGISDAEIAACDNTLKLSVRSAVSSYGDS